MHNLIEAFSGFDFGEWLFLAVLILVEVGLIMWEVNR